MIVLVYDGSSDGIWLGGVEGGSPGAFEFGLGSGGGRGCVVFDGIVLVLDNISNSDVVLVFSRWVRFLSWHSGQQSSPSSNLTVSNIILNQY